MLPSYLRPGAAAPVDRPRFRPDIEGLRGVAVALVVAYHAAVPGLQGGYVGVDVFFVLSGYLITWLLVHEVERTGTVNLRAFYARRARRLLPAMAVLLVAVTAFAFAFYAPVEQGPVARTALATAAYVSNLHFAAGATDYLAADAETDPLLHTWSLSVEEQFYLGWPVLVLVLLVGLRRGAGGPPDRARLLVGLAVAAAASFALSVYLMGSLRAHWAFFASPTRAWEFAVGGLGVLLPRLGARRAGTAPADSAAAAAGGAGTALGWAGLAAVVAAGALYSARTPFPGWAALVPTLGTVLVLRAGASERPTRLGAVLGWRPLQEAGRLSYSWYLWHWPVLVFAAGLSNGPIHELPALTRAALVALSLALAEASYRLVENPVRHGRWLAATPGRGLGLGAALTALGVALALGWGALAGEMAQRPDQARYAQVKQDGHGGCSTPYEETDATGCTRGDGPTPVVLFGDSHAGYWLPAVLALAEERGWTVHMMNKMGCPAIFSPKYEAKLRRVYEECEAWKANAVERIQEIGPAIVFTASSNYQTYSEAEWRAGLDAAFGALSKAADHVVHLQSIPFPGFDVPQCLSREAWSPVQVGPAGCRFDEALTRDAHVWEWEHEAAAAYPNVHVADLTEAICPGGTCLAERDGTVLYLDNGHLTATFSRSLAAPLGRQLDRLLGPPVRTASETAAP